MFVYAINAIIVYLFLEVAIVSLPQILWDLVDPTSLSIGVLTLCPCTRRQLSH